MLSLPRELVGLVLKCLDRKDVIAWCSTCHEARTSENMRALIKTNRYVRHQNMCVPSSLLALVPDALWLDMQAHDAVYQEMALVRGQLTDTQFIELVDQFPNRFFLKITSALTYGQVKHLVRRRVRHPGDILIRSYDYNRGSSFDRLITLICSSVMTDRGCEAPIRMIMEECISWCFDSPIIVIIFGHEHVPDDRATLLVNGRRVWKSRR